MMTSGKCSLPARNLQQLVFAPLIPPHPRHNDRCETFCVPTALVKTVEQFGDVHNGTCPHHGYGVFDHSEEHELYGAHLTIDMWKKSTSGSDVPRFVGAVRALSNGVFRGSASPLCTGRTPVVRAHSHYTVATTFSRTRLARENKTDGHAPPHVAIPPDRCCVAFPPSPWDPWYSVCKLNRWIRHARPLCCICRRRRRCLHHRRRRRHHYHHHHDTTITIPPTHSPTTTTAPCSCQHRLLPIRWRQRLPRRTLQRVRAQARPLPRLHVRPLQQQHGCRCRGGGTRGAGADVPPHRSRQGLS